MMVSVAGFTVPSFVLALVLVLVFSVQLGWLPSAGSDSADERDPADRDARRRAAPRSWRASPARPCSRCWASPISAPPRPRACTWRTRRRRACAAQCRDPDHDHRRLHGRHPDRRRRGGRKRVRLARHRPAAGVGGGQSRPRGGAGDPAAGRRHHGDRQHHRRLRLWLARSAPARAGALSAAAEPPFAQQRLALLRGVAAAHPAGARLDRADGDRGVRRRPPRALFLHRARPARAAGAAGLHGRQAGPIRWAATSSAATCSRGSSCRSASAC